MKSKKPLRSRSNLAKAVRFAARAHKGQFREGIPALPYVTHPIDVMNRLRYVGNITDEEILIAAALHDLVEETDTTTKDIEEKFGKSVRALVTAMTRTEPTPAKSRCLDEPALWRLRHDLLMSDIKKMDRRAQTIKLADRVSNLQGAIALRTGEKLHRYLWQSARILEIIHREVCPSLWDDISAMLGKCELPSDWTPPRVPETGGKAPKSLAATQQGSDATGNGAKRPHR